MSLTWHPAGQSVSFLDLKIPDGMVHSHAGRTAWPGEPSAIHVDLPVAKKAEDIAVDLGYYPHYEQITPAQRRTYLEWLAKGRRDENPGERALGYVFLFFYGLERRICLEKDRDPAVLQELAGLLEHYAPAHKSRSLRGYFLSLAHFASWQHGHEEYRGLWPQLFELDEGKTGDEPLKLVLANLFERQEPMHWSVAYRMAMLDPESKRSVVVSRAQQEVWHLFQTRYESEFSGGMKLKAAKQKAEYRHEPASAALVQASDARRRACGFAIANVRGAHSQFRRIPEIWNSCLDDLSGYSRVKTSKKADAAGVQAWLALPPELRSKQPCPMEPFWAWVKEHAPLEKGVHFVKMSGMARWFGLPEKPKLSNAQARGMADGIAAMGWCMAPHPAYVGHAYDWEQEVAVYPFVGPQGKDPHLQGLVGLVYLFMPVASADGTVDSSELGAFHKTLRTEIATMEDWQHVRATEAALMRDTNVALKALGAMIKEVEPGSKKAILHLLLQVAAADGEVSPDEMKILRRITRLLGLPPEMPERMLREDIGFRDVVVAEGSGARKNDEPIPTRPAVPQVPGLQLNRDRIADLTRETHEVVALLSTVMSHEEEANGQPLAATAAAPQPDASDVAWMKGLEVRFHAALLELAIFDELPAADFDKLAKKHRLLPDDLANSVNAWADEALGDFLLERSASVRVYRALLPES